MAGMHQSLLELQTLTSALDDQSVPKLKAPTREDLSNPVKLRHLLENAERVSLLLRDAARIRRTLSDQWVDWLRCNFEARHSQKPLFQALLQKRIEMEGILEIRRQFLGVAIEWEDGWENDDELFTAVQNASAGRNPFGLLPFGKKVARERLQKLRINGQAPKEESHWKQIATYFDLLRQSRTLSHGWNALAAGCGPGHF